MISSRSSRNEREREGERQRDRRFIRIVRFSPRRMAEAPSGASRKWGLKRRREKTQAKTALEHAQTLLTFLSKHSHNPSFKSLLCASSAHISHQRSFSCGKVPAAFPYTQAAARKRPRSLPCMVCRKQPSAFHAIPCLHIKICGPCKARLCAKSKHGNNHKCPVCKQKCSIGSIDSNKKKRGKPGVSKCGQPIGCGDKVGMQFRMQRQRPAVAATKSEAGVCSSMSDTSSDPESEILQQSLPLDPSNRLRDRPRSPQSQWKAHKKKKLYWDYLRSESFATADRRIH